MEDLYGSNAYFVLSNGLFLRIRNMRYHVINPEDATATVSGESVEMTLNAIDDVHSPVSAQIQTTLSVETAEKLASQLHSALMLARAHRANR
jgi:hypothetical protein